jgi:signal transduction histidine kinase
LENILFSATNISNLVNDLLDLAKMESNNFQFNEDYFDLINSLISSIEQQKFLSQKKNIDIKLSFKSKIQNKKEKKQNVNESYFSVTDSLELDNKELSILNCIMGDQSRYIQILQNFLSNAVKFTNNGGTINVVVTMLEIQDIFGQKHKDALK